MDRLCIEYTCTRRYLTDDIMFPGGLQDYAYTTHAMAHVTLELHCCKYPPEGELGGFWNRNEESIMRYLETFNNG